MVSVFIDWLESWAAQNQISDNTASFCNSCQASTIRSLHIGTVCFQFKVTKTLNSEASSSRCMAHSLFIINRADIIWMGILEWYMSAVSITASDIGYFRWYLMETVSQHIYVDKYHEIDFQDQTISTTPAQITQRSQIWPFQRNLWKCELLYIYFRSLRNYIYIW